MRLTLIIGFASAKSVRARGARSRIVPPPPVDLLAQRHGLGVVPLAPDALRVHRGQRVTSPTFRAALLSNLERYRQPGLTVDFKRGRLGPSRFMVVRDQKGHARSGQALGVGFHLHTGRFVALQVGLALQA